MTRRSRGLAALLFAAVALVACGSDDEDGAAPTTEAPASTAGIPWDDLGEVDLGAGWAIVDAEGDAPVLDIERDGARVGLVEINRYDVDTLPAVVAALPDGERAALRAHVDEFLRSLAADRREGCAPDHRLTPLDTRFVDGPEGLVVSYGFRAGAAGAPDTEIVRHWAGLRDDELVLVQVAAYDEGSCPGTDGAELTLADFSEVEPLIAPMIEASDLPPAATGSGRA